MTQVLEMPRQTAMPRSPIIQNERDFLSTVLDEDFTVDYSVPVEIQCELAHLPNHPYIKWPNFGSTKTEPETKRIIIKRLNCELTREELTWGMSLERCTMSDVYALLSVIKERGCLDFEAPVLATERKISVGKFQGYPALVSQGGRHKIDMLYLEGKFEAGMMVLAES